MFKNKRKNDFLSVILPKQFIIVLQPITQVFAMNI